MNNFGLLCFCLALGLYAGKEFIDWFWWYYWSDDEEEENPAPVLCTTWWVWEWIGKVRFWVWLKIWRHVQRGLWAIRRHFSPPQLPEEPVDRDGRTPEEWLLIAIIGVWDLYKDGYDQNIKKKWDEYLKTHDANKGPEAGDARSEP